MEKEKFQVLSWNEFYWDIFDLGKKIKNNYKADVLIAIARGGWVVGRIISDFLGIDKVASIGVKFYKDINCRSEKPVITQPLAMSIENQKVLIVDDIADTGETVKVVKEYILERKPKDVKIAVVYIKPWCRTKVDYFIKETDKWVVFPYEQMETINYLLRKMRLKGLEEEEVLTTITSLGFDEFTIKKVLKQLKT